MVKKVRIQKSISEQIFEELFLLLHNQEEFDKETLEKLEQLASSGELKKAQKVAQAIKASAEGES